MKINFTIISIFSLVVLFTFSSCKKPPLLTTVPITLITESSALSGGNVLDNGGADITSCGIVWGTSPYPTLSNNFLNDYTGASSYTINISGLTPSTTYYVRAYATNSAGTAYGNQVIFTTTSATGNAVVSNPGQGVTFNGYTYPSIVLGNGQEWMSENLRTNTYSNGATIANVTNSIQWMNLTTGAWAYYENDVQNQTAYGKLYNWYAVTDPRNVCPSGWHVPTYAEWTELTDYLGGELVAGGKLKSTGLTFWDAPNNDATNEIGFSGLPGGLRYVDGSFWTEGESGWWWSSTEAQGQGGQYWHRHLETSNGTFLPGTDYASMGMSVRCLKD